MLLSKKILLTTTALAALFAASCTEDSGFVLPGDIDADSATLAAAPLLTDEGAVWSMGGDIILDKASPEHLQLAADLDESAEGSTGSLARTDAMRYVVVPAWPKGVVNYTMTGFTAAEQTIIKQAMTTISSYAKVTYTPVKKGGAYVYAISKIKSTTIGGQSTIGYSTQSYCQLSQVIYGTVVHEFLHGLGFGHEHQRYDRDSYVTINTANINPQYVSQLQKIPQFTTQQITTITNGRRVVTTNQIPYTSTLSTYDYNSIMHYPANAFAKSASLATINAKGKTIGNRTAMSAADIAALKAVYGAR